jgi:NAD(P)H-flavin reductase
MTAHADGLQRFPPAGLPDPFWPWPAVVREVELESPGVATFRLELQGGDRPGAETFEPGQFNMLFVPGVGEAAISISGAPRDRPGIEHTIRFVGMVTRTIEQLRPGGMLGVRGPYGRGWPLAPARGGDVLIVAGGLGLAPLRPAVQSLLSRRSEYGRVVLVYGARSPADLLYQREYDAWRQQGLEILATVDRADETWRGQVGVVPLLLGRVGLEGDRTTALVCGPEVMMRFTIYDLLRRMPAERIFLSIERNMQCGVGLCGRCQVGPYFLCKDGPVFAYSQLARFFQQEHF